jgi:hypothetical protein
MKQSALAEALGRDFKGKISQILYGAPEQEDLRQDRGLAEPTLLPSLTHDNLKELDTATEQHYFGAYCISPLPKDQSSRAESTKLIQMSSFRTFSCSCISSAILL